jgi:hypothetical protein
MLILIVFSDAECHIFSIMLGVFSSMFRWGVNSLTAISSTANSSNAISSTAKLIYSVNEFARCQLINS